jgi:hypothetical protein
MILIQLKVAGVQYLVMTWKDIRLELAQASRFPHGSPHRCYLLHVPLGLDGLIDESQVRASPKRATVRRFWPSERDLRGQIVKTGDGWAFAYEPRNNDHEMLFGLDINPIRLGECITLTEPDGKKLPFRITAIN